MKNKKLLLLILPLLFVSCNSKKEEKTSEIITESASIVSVVESETSVLTESASQQEVSMDLEKNTSESTSELVSSSLKVSSSETKISSLESKGTSSYSYDEEYDGVVPANMNSKVVLGHDNASSTKFEFNNEMPDYFRYIYGRNFTKGQWYANGELKISSTTAAKQGFQSCMFDPGDDIESGPKLELRILIGQMNNSSGEKCDEDIPVFTIDEFSSDGTKLRTYTVDNFDKTKENGYVRIYMNANGVSYFELRVTQLPYKGSQKYNFGLRGIEMIAWPFALKE